MLCYVYFFYFLFFLKIIIIINTIKTKPTHIVFLYYINATPTTKKMIDISQLLNNPNGTIVLPITSTENFNVDLTGADSFVCNFDTNNSLTAYVNIPIKEIIFGNTIYGLSNIITLSGSPATNVVNISAQPYSQRLDLSVEMYAGALKSAINFSAYIKTETGGVKNPDIALPWSYSATVYTWAVYNTAFFYIPANTQFTLAIGLGAAGTSTLMSIDNNTKISGKLTMA